MEPAIAFSYKNIPAFLIAPFILNVSFDLRLKSVSAFPRYIAPTPDSLRSRSLSVPSSSLYQILSASNMSSFSSIQPLPSASYCARSLNPSPLFVPNSSEPSFMIPSSFLSRLKKPFPPFNRLIFSSFPSQSRSK